MAAGASPELLTAGHSEMKRRLKRAVSAPSSLPREELGRMLPGFPTKASATLGALKSDSDLLFWGHLRNLNSG